MSEKSPLVRSDRFRSINGVSGNYEAVVVTERVVLGNIPPPPPS
jgi:hypothetical protein